MPIEPSFTQHFMQFLDASPTSWHAVDAAAAALDQSGFIPLDQTKSWKLKPGGRYYVSHQGATICAFIMPKKKIHRLRMAAAHSDSPGFKLKPQAEFERDNVLLLGVEVYGSPLIASWLNRDLGIAGRVALRSKEGIVSQQLINIADNPLIIPQLAIHLDRNVNETGLQLNKQEHLAAIAAVGWQHGSQSNYLDTILKKHGVKGDLLSHDLFLYPLERARLIGMHQELLSSYRLDNLSSAYAILEALKHTASKADDVLRLGIIWNHEEIGSETTAGAGSPFFTHLLERISLSAGMNREEFLRLGAQSICLSIDLAHALHPLYPEKHEPRHRPLMNGGVVIKSNAQQRYATDAIGAAHVIDLCRRHHIPHQHFVSRNDIPCGSTIGPIHASLTGITTVDIGIPQWSMHSVREVISCADQFSLAKLVSSYLSSQ